MQSLRSRAGRIASLDALRGIAALVVVLHHYVKADPQPWLLLTPFRMIAFGRPPVIIFFVLSGFVLSLPFLSGNGPSYKAFAIKRICRIYLPFAAAVMLALIPHYFLAHLTVAELNGWFNALWDQDMTPRMLLSHLAMTGRRRENLLTPVIWSLVYEARISAIFPLLVLLALRRTGQSLALAFVLSIGCTLGIVQLAGSENWGPYYWSTTPLDGILHTAYFIVFFVAGIALAKHADAVTQVLGRSRLARAVLWLVALVALSWNWDAYGVDLMYLLGAVLVIALCLASASADRLLNAAPLQWLGRVSYSLYLVHVPILLITAHLLDGRVPMALLLPIYLALALLGAALMHRFVEAPSIELGRHLTKVKPAAMGKPVAGE